MQYPNLTRNQNFIKDKVLVEALVKRAGIKNSDLVIEIGTGKGLITEVLSIFSRSVISYELDPTLFFNARTLVNSYTNLQIKNEDFTLSVLPFEPYKVFANIPFDQTSRIINKLIFAKNYPESISVIVQREAAQRFMGKGEGHLLNLLIRACYKISIIHTFKKTDFEPIPSVDTVLLHFEKNSKPYTDNDLYLYRDFVCFVLLQQKSSLWLRVKDVFTKEQFYRMAKDLNFDGDITASTLRDSLWFSIFDIFRKYVTPQKQGVVRGAFKQYLYKKDHQPKDFQSRTTRAKKGLI